MKKQINGNLKLESIDYRGDNIGDDWEMTFTFNSVSKTLYKNDLPMKWNKLNEIDKLLFAGPITTENKNIYVQGKEEDMFWNDKFNTIMSLEGGEAGVADYNHIGGSFFFVEVSIPDNECKLTFKYSYEVRRK